MQSWRNTAVLLSLASLFPSPSLAHTCGYLRAAYDTVGGGNETCCGRPDETLVLAPEVQRVLFSFPLAERESLHVAGGHADASYVDDSRFMVVLLRPPGTVEDYLAKLAGFVHAQPVDAYVPEVPRVLSLDDLTTADRERMRHALGDLPMQHFPVSRSAF